MRVTCRKIIDLRYKGPRFRESGHLCLGSVGSRFAIWTHDSAFSYAWHGEDRITVGTAPDEAAGDPLRFFDSYTEAAMQLLKWVEESVAIQSIADDMTATAASEATMRLRDLVPLGARPMKLVAIDVTRAGVTKGGTM